MRKITTTLVLMVLALTLTGCGNRLVKKSIEQAKTAIESKEYDKALISLELALDEDKENKEVNKLYGIVDGYQKAKKLIDENNFDEAKKILDGINEDYTSYAIKEDIDVLKGYVETYTKENENIISVLAKAEELYNNKQYTECKMSLYKNIVGTHVDEEIEPNKYATEEQKAKAEDLIVKCDQAIMEIQKQKEAEEKRKAEEEKKKQEAQEGITESKAIQLVKQYLENNGKYIPNGFSIDSETDTEYKIQAYDNMGTHIATSGWYTVNKKSGKVESMF